MKKSEFEKLRVGDIVTLRTLDEIRELKCCVLLHGDIAVVGDDQVVRRVNPSIAGKQVRITYSEVSDTVVNAKLCETNAYVFVVRQHLKGGK